MHPINFSGEEERKRKKSSGNSIYYKEEMMFLWALQPVLQIKFEIVWTPHSNFFSTSAAINIKAGLIILLEEKRSTCDIGLVLQMASKMPWLVRQVVENLFFFLIPGQIVLLG